MTENKENESEITPDIFAETFGEKELYVNEENTPDNTPDNTLDNTLETPVPDENPSKDEDPFDILLGNENHPNVLAEPIDIDTPAMQQGEPAKIIATPEPEPKREIPEDKILDLQRSEEIEAELVKTNGRYIESVDNARVGTTIYGEKVDKDPNRSVKSFVFATQQQEPAYIGNGFNTEHKGNGPLDTGEGSQKESKLTEVYAEEINDPRSENFLACVNSACQYRETCVRYRLKDKRINQSVFFPEQCRIDGTYISLDDTSFTGYDNMATLEDKVAPTSLGEPE